MTRSQLIFQRDGGILVTPGRNQDQVTTVVRACAELQKIVAGSYLYKLSSIALWGSAARGIDASHVLKQLNEHSAGGVPGTFAARIAETMSRYGVLRVHADAGGVRLTSSDPTLLHSIDLGIDLQDSNGLIPVNQVGRVKVLAARAGWPVVDTVPRHTEEVSVQLRDTVRLRDYQSHAVESFRRAGSGIVLLPCGAGKTVVGVAALCAASARTLILGPSRSVLDQWRSTLLEMTTLEPHQVAIADSNEPLPVVTLATYHAASFGQAAGNLLDVPWGLVIYDEVQSLPADVFRLSAALPSVRKLGLSATLVREDGRQREVFALIGPPVYDVPWSELQEQGWIAPARCSEVRIPESTDAAQRERYKMAVVERLLAKHPESPTLIVGSSLAGLRAVGERFNIPVLTGSSSRRQRSDLLQAFRSGTINRLALSRIGSVGIDLPEAEVLIQVSGTFGSRQEEAQRLGRLLRPGHNKVARFYSLVSAGTAEVRYAEKRQRFLVEQGYSYELVDAADLPRPPSGS